MSTYAELQALIADDLDRSDLTSQIQTAIKDAIDHYEKQRFYFNESRSLTFSTVDGQEFYTSADSSDIPNLIMIDIAKLTISAGDAYELDRVPYSDLEHDSTSVTIDEGRPTDIAYYGKQIRLYPIPDAVYTVRVSGVFSLPELSADSDENVWTTDAKHLIRSRALWDLYTYKIKDPQSAQIMEQAEAKELGKLLTETSSRKATGKMKPTQF